MKPRVTFPATALLALSCVGSSPLLAQQAGQRLSDASEQQLIDALSTSAATTRSFMPTAPPDVRTNECRGSNSKDEGGSGGRNLEVVPYGGEATASVSLDIGFDHGSDRLSERDRKLLDTLARALNSPQLTGKRFTVSGHTDATGALEVNLRLSCARALSASRYLQGRGIGAVRMSAYGFGPNRPLPGTQAVAPENRRVEISMAP